MAPRAASPIAAPIITCSAMKFWKKRSRMLLLELVAERRVLHVGVERDNPLVSRHRAWPARCRTLRAWPRCRRSCTRASRRCPSSADSRPALVAARAGPSGSGAGSSSGTSCDSSSGERVIELLALLERLAVPAVLALGNRDAFALEGAGQNHRRLPFRAARLLERIEDRREVVPIDDDRVPAEGTPASASASMSCCHMVGPALPEAVDVGDAAQRVETVVRRSVCRFPDRAFSRFAVAEQRIGAVVGFDAPRVERRADGRADALAKRALLPRRRMSSRGVGCPSRSESNAPQREQVCRGRSSPASAHAA